MQTGTVSRLWLRWRSWRFKIYFWWNFMRFWKSYICSKKFGCVRNKLQFHTVQQNLKVSLWNQDWDLTVFPLLIYGIWLFLSLETRFRPWSIWSTRLQRNQGDQRSQGKINVLTDIDCVPSNVQSSHQEALLYVFEDNEAVIKMIYREEARQKDMFPEPSELLLIGCSIELIWIPKFKSNTSTPKTNSQTC